MSTKDLGITVKKAADLSEWYTQVVTKAQLADYSSAKGFMVLMPHGFSIWESIKEHFDKRIKEIGHRNAYFPLLIPERLLKREAEHFEGFTPEVFWVTHSGNNELGERLAIRPTSETIINDAYSRWVKSWRDLPVLINVWNSVLRAEITSTKPFIRTSEFLWQEGHTVHETEEEAEKEVMTILEIYRRLVEDQIAIPVLVGKKTEREKFKGAVYTTTVEAMMPDGKAIQMGTSHHLGQNFSKPFEIKYLGKDEKEHFAWTTSWGISWRLIGAMIMAHGDDKGLVLPPRVAPTQVVFVPIHYKESDKTVILQMAHHIAESLGKHSIRRQRLRRKSQTGDRSNRQNRPLQGIRKRTVRVLRCSELETGSLRKIILERLRSGSPLVWICYWMRSLLNPSRYRLQIALFLAHFHRLS